MDEFAAFSIKKPKSCAACELLINRNNYSGSCIINKDFRMPLDKNKRADNCPLIFIDEERHVFPATSVREAFDALFDEADLLEDAANDAYEDDEIQVKSTWKRQGILTAIRMFGEKLRILDVDEWFDD